MPSDRYGAFGDDVSTPARRSTPIVPHDTNDLPIIPKALLIGTGGVIVGRLVDDTEDRTFTVPAGYHPLRFRLVKATGTTASNMLGLD